ncbi:MAG: 16S rRNA (uracil(1498)-N(3))-methyltransferase [Pseudonocardiaceae bacterium]
MQGGLGEGMPPVFLLDAVPAGDHVVLDGAEARHAATVRRLRAGEHLVLTDGAGHLARCTVEAVRTGRVAELELVIHARWQEPKPALRVIVAQALVKGDRGELAVELATEAGADGILPWRAERSIARWGDGPRGQKALARWRATARSAAKQARRAWLPEVAEPVGTPALAQVVRECAAALVLDAGADRTIGELQLPSAGDLILVVGPEGGITPSEIDRLTHEGALPVRLGPTVLRASTAAVVALGALGVATQRWA